jgi:hypothetical protein
LLLIKFSLFKKKYIIKVEYKFNTLMVLWST